MLFRSPSTLWDVSFQLSFIAVLYDQSIYGFRGASPEYLLHIQQSFPKVKVYALSENHRNTPNLVTLASKIIGENTHRYEKSVTAKKQSPGKIRFEVFGSVEKALKKISRLLQKEAMDTAILYRNHLSALPWYGAQYHIRNNVNFGWGCARTRSLFVLRSARYESVVARLRLGSGPCGGLLPCDVKKSAIVG